MPSRGSASRPGAVMTRAWSRAASAMMVRISARTVGIGSPVFKEIITPYKLFPILKQANCIVGTTRSEPKYVSGTKLGRAIIVPRSEGIACIEPMKPAHECPCVLGLDCETTTVYSGGVICFSPFGWFNPLGAASIRQSFGRRTFNFVPGMIWTLSGVRHGIENSGVLATIRKHTRTTRWRGNFDTCLIRYMFNMSVLGDSLAILPRQQR